MRDLKLERPKVHSQSVVDLKFQGEVDRVEKEKRLDEKLKSLLGKDPEKRRLISTLAKQPIKSFGKGSLFSLHKTQKSLPLLKHI